MRKHASHAPEIPALHIGRRERDTHRRPVLEVAQLFETAPAHARALVAIGQIGRPGGRWHRTGFRAYWRWKPRPRSGRPRPRWKSVSSFARSVSPTHYGAHRGFMASFSSSASMSDKPPLQNIWRPPSQGWKTLLHNHADGVDGPIRGRDNLITTALRAAATASRSPPNPVAGSDRASNG
jgi:hypothetical protein